MIQRLRLYLALDGLGSTFVRALAGSAGLRIIGMVFGFLVGIQLARGLGAAGYGVYGVVMSIISLITIPTEFGLPQLVTREVAAAQVRNDQLFIRGVLHWANRTVIILSQSMAVLGLLGWLLFKEKFSDGIAIALLAGIPLVPLVALGNLRGAALRGLQKIVRGQFPEVVLRPAVFSLLLFLASVFLPAGLSPTAAMIMQVIAAAVALIVAVFLLKDLLPEMERVAIPATHAKAWLRSALPMALTEGMRMLHGNVSILLLGVISTSTIVGIFRVASSASMLLTMPVTLMHVVSAPVFARLHAAGDRKKLQRMLGWVAMAMVTGVTIVALPFILVGPQLLGRVFGAEFGASNTPLLILSVGTLIGSAFGAGATLLNMTGHEKRVTRAFGISLIVLALLSLPFISIWGAVGAASANSIAFILWSALMWLDARRLLNLDTSIIQFIHEALRFRQK
jgi:O-antigen/teichoic acid export membrane protein